jgi:hypothetical protein
MPTQTAISRADVNSVPMAISTPLVCSSSVRLTPKVPPPLSNSQ